MNKFSLDDAIKYTGIIHRYKKWLQESLKIAAEKKYITYDGNFYSVTGKRPPQMAEIMEHWLQKRIEWEKEEGIRAQAILVDATIRSLPDILTGKQLATDVMFPAASMKLVEGIYKDNPIADYFNHKMAETVITYLKEQAANNTETEIKILEIGAGTGGTSKGMFDCLKEYQRYVKEYCYTDISQVFLNFAEEAYGDEVPYLTYQILDIEAPVVEQEIELRSYDIVLAANVLHATKNMRKTLRNTKSLLKKGGLLLVNEISQNMVFNHMTFGLLEGWWLYEDELLRIPGCPGISYEMWKNILEREGFLAIKKENDKEDIRFGQQIISALSDGIYTCSRQKKETNRSANAIKEKTVSVPASGFPVISASNDLSEGVKKILRKNLSEILKLNSDKLKDDRKFAEYGVDSIVSVNFINAINKQLKISLPVTVLFDYYNINLLADYIDQEYKEQLSEKEALSETVFPSLGNQGAMNQDIDKKAVSYNSFYEAEEALKAYVNKNNSEDEIAIIGISGRFASAENCEEFWKSLSEGRELIEPVSRWDLSKHYNPDAKFCNAGSFLKDIETFDPLFFNISGTEATYMDPQQRVFLEEAWRALEDAGYAGNALKGAQCGVYVGCSNMDYEKVLDENVPAQASWGNTASIIPARISYCLDLQGPAVTIDTACSSSLVAVHLACQGLKSKETDMALAGGVFIQSTPTFYNVLNRAGMLSKTGHCYTFDERADGFVPGEGAGVVVLKRLKEAVRDGDHIYGVIKGSGINQDGNTNGITAPSVKSQERLECEVYNKYQINPGDIQMVEAHGTGTKLGDPIEYQALTKAFQRYTNRKEFCAIGSVKTNIGHVSAAAGIAGLMKILLSLKHKQIPPSLNFRKGNENISFADSPFYVNTIRKDWVIKEGKKRLAALNSFGLSGTNAHMVIEEALDGEIKHDKKIEYLIVLSARNLEQLKKQAQQLAEFCKANPKIDCGNMSYTLFLGRKHLNCRLACVISEQEEVEHLLRKWLDGENDSDLYVSEKNITEVTHQKEEEWQGNEIIETLPFSDDEIKRREQLIILAKLYIQGYKLEYSKLFTEQYSRIPLPAYPFAGEKYWGAAKGEMVSGPEIAEKTDILHPLLHRNTSNLAEQKYTSRLTGSEFFLSAHKIKGNTVLPGVAYLEMARAAIWDSLEEKPDENHTMMMMQNIVWSKPLIVKEVPVTAQIRIVPEENGSFRYEVSSSQNYPAFHSDNQIIHSTGIIKLCPKKQFKKIELSELQREYTKEILAPVDCYKKFLKMGIEYGPAHQAIAKIYQGEKGVLAKLMLPDCVKDTMDTYILHPSLLDAALQASIGIMADPDRGVLHGPALPYSIEEFSILGRCSSEMWVLIQESRELQEEKVQKVDAALYDASGKCCVFMKGVTFRILEEEREEVLILEPVFQECSLKNRKKSSMEQRVILYCGRHTEETAESSANSNIKRIPLFSAADGLAERFTDYALQAFQIVQDIMKSKTKEQVLIQVIGEKESGFSAIYGLLNTAQQENTNIVGQVIELESWEAVEKILVEESQNTEDHHIRYSDGKRCVKKWKEYKPEEKLKEFPAIPWKDGGTYLITGGMGGLGMIFARDLAVNTKHANVILTGRSTRTKEIENKLGNLEELGIHAEYWQADIGEKTQTKALINEIVERFQGLNGIIHSAGIIQDHYILEKEEEEFRQVLYPKVSGTVNLDEAAKDSELDFFVLFSSIAGVKGNPGQADYATANAFLDWYAEYRNNLLQKRKRNGRTISIDWSLWEHGGMQVNKEIEQMLKNKGISALEEKEGSTAFARILSNQMPNAMVVKGTLVQLRKKMLREEPYETAAEEPNSIKERELLQKIQEVLIQLISNVLKVRKEEIDVEADLNEYGFDSISFTELINRINEEFGLELTPAIFFENQSINCVAGYLLKNHRGVIKETYEPANKLNLQNDSKKDIVQAKEGAADRKIKARFQTSPANKAVGSEKEDPIVIVGMSGKFPMSEDIEELWENLVKGTDCIEEIPQKRWDWREYYGDSKTEENKTEIKWGGFISGVDEFDPSFFGISPREAELMDPQQRLLMTYVWKTIEDAGHSAKSLAGSKLGIFIGTTSSSYNDLINKAKLPNDSYSITGIVSSIGPNRMSYFLDTHGPSEPIETACSSSLVALYHAMSAIEKGDCDAAIVGGVNTILTPDGHISISKAGMLSKTGRCKTFSDQADGYVRSEGVGMIFVKKQSDAEEAGDHIYGIIRSIYENHGGKANSLTAPNPKAQAALLKQTYLKAGIDPRTISYIETHGTGTVLGDPIEINGIKTAFQELFEHYDIPWSNQTPYCGIGSIKTNIGHLELAAGIAGLIKILLQFQHKKLVKNLHFNNLNPYIHLEDSPFYIVNETREWKALKDAYGNEIPRRGGLSSFSFGGVNVHVILEEYLPKEAIKLEERRTPEAPALIILSAKNRKRLTERVQQLYNELKNRRFTEEDLADLAFTLQVGRDEMEERIGIIVTSVLMLEKKLKEYLDGKECIENFYIGQIKNNKSIFSLLASDQDMEDAIAGWLKEGKYNKVLDLWTKGLNVKWEKLYATGQLRRLRLPTYPFAKERYWLPEKKEESEDAFYSVNSHPFITKNISTFWSQSFYSFLGGEEKAFSECIINGRKRIPEVVFFELVLAATLQSFSSNHSGDYSKNSSIIHIKNNKFNFDILEKRPLKLITQLVPEDDSNLHYVIYEKGAKTEEEQEKFCEGDISLMEKGTAAIRNLSSLRNQCSRKKIPPEEIYQYLAGRKVEYGFCYHTYEQIIQGTDIAMIKVKLTDVQNKDNFMIYPTLVEPVIRIALDLMSDLKENVLTDSRLITLEEIEVLEPCAEEMWAVIEKGKDEDTAKIDFCKEDGSPCIRIKNLTFTKGKEKRKQDVFVSPEDKAGYEIAGYEEIWAEETSILHSLDLKRIICFLSSKDRQQEVWKEFKRYQPDTEIIFLSNGKEYKRETSNSYLICAGEKESYEKAFASIREDYDEIDSIIYLWALEDKKMILNYDSLLFIIQTMVSKELHIKKLVLGGAFENHLQYCYLDSWIGLERSLRLLLPKTQISIILEEQNNIPDSFSADEWIKRIFIELSAVKSNSVLYREGKRHTAIIQPVSLRKKEKSDMIKPNGTYIITGGFGGIGFIFAQYLAQKHANLIIIGRTYVKEEESLKWKELKKYGIQVMYIQENVSNLSNLKLGLEKARERFGKLDGLIHAAGIQGKRNIFRNDKEDFQEVINPKIAGTIVLEDLLKEDLLDFICYFSSASSIVGDFGSCDYSIANRFLSAHARSYKKKGCRIVSISWPTWRNGGMGGSAEEDVDTYLKTSGQRYLENDEGIEIFERALAQDEHAFLILSGQKKRMEKLLGIERRN
nr:SDR family NAD(P)-dependent oxidoreductase [uncultured Clostridium sp.]